MNGPYPEITNISSLAKLFFKTFISLKHLSDYRTVYWTVGLSDCRIIATAPMDTLPSLQKSMSDGHTTINTKKVCLTDTLPSIQKCMSN